jgi:2-C-methyl-D-erythritol 4-phosphate cytidylyltransferase
VEHVAVGVVIPAGGKGLRLGESTPKQFIELEPGWPILRYALETFHGLSEISAIALVLPAEYVSQYSGWLAGYAKVRLAVGGVERWQSVQNGVKALPEACESVLVHDAARPFVTADQVLACLHLVQDGRCCTLGMPCTDTIKQVSGDAVTGTLDRRRLIAVQTPQGFTREALNEMYAHAETGTLAHATDECMFAEAIGRRVFWVRGGHNARKITEAEDLLWARWMVTRLRGNAGNS